jgi:phosphatidylserine decarboxylase
MLDLTLLGGLLALLTALPLAWKWGLGVRRTAVVLAALAMLSGLLVARSGSTGIPSEGRPTVTT